jgi:hypothetical protein
MNIEQLQQLKAAALAANKEWPSNAEESAFHMLAYPSVVLELIELAERATAAPAEKVNTPEFAKLLIGTYRHVVDGHGNQDMGILLKLQKAEDALYAHIAQRIAAAREAGRQEVLGPLGFDEGGSQLVTRLMTTANEASARAERAEAELEEWRFTNKVDELNREVDRLRAALASRPAVDLVLRSRVADLLHLLEHLPFSSDGDIEQARKAMADVRALLPGKVEAPTVKESLPVAPTATKTIADTIVYVCPERDIECGDNKTAWCATCPKRPKTRPTASADGLPPLPAFDMDEYFNMHSGGVQLRERYDWHMLESAIKAYARQARADALEEAARLCESEVFRWSWSDDVKNFAKQVSGDIRALNKGG